MKRRLFPYLIVMFFLFACARERHHVETIPPPRLKTIVLPEKGKKLEPYVINGKRYYPLPDSHGFVQHGKASWYGKKFHGRPTANGEIFDMYKKSAAHKTLPMDTYVRVLNPSNKQHTIVRINDRGPFVKGRIIDLSYKAAKEIGLIGPGVTDVKIVALGKEVGTSESKSEATPILELMDMKKGEFTIQVGAFHSKDNAIRLADRLKVIFNYVKVSEYRDENKRILYRVHVSKSETLTQAGEIEKKLEDMGFSGAFIMRI